MNPKQTTPNLLALLRSQTWTAAVIWSVCIVASLVWNLHEQDRNLVKLASNTAQVTFENDVLYRRWAAIQGGVYVRTTDRNEANPYLHVPERDVTTTSGLSLTLVNPAYMARMVNQMAADTHGSRGHITSLKPIRPANAPDAWERAALQAFETGTREVSSVEQLDGREYLRIMRPFLTEEACLKCHAAQGYKVGDIRGGISVSVPMAPLRAVAQAPVANLATAHLGLWLIGMVGIGLSNRALGRHLRAREQAESSLRESQATLRSFYDSSPFMMGVVELEGKDGCHLSELGGGADIRQNASTGPGSAAAWTRSTGEVPHLWIERFQQSRCDSVPVRFEYQHPTPSGDHWINATVSFLGESHGTRPRFSFVAENITERKQAEEALRESEERYRLLVEQAVDGIFVSDAGGHYLSVNSAGAAMLGYTPTEIIRLTIADVIAGDEVPRLPVEVAKFADGRVICSEWLLRRKDGSFFPGEVVGRQLPNGRLLAILRDITDRRQAQDALRQAHDRLELRVRERTAELSQAVATLHEEVARRSRVEQTLRERSEQIAQAGHGIDPGGTARTPAAGRDPA